MMHIPSPIPSTSAAVACVLLAMFACVPQGAAQAPAASASDPILVENSKVQIRKSDYELELLRLPPDIRPGFANSERRVNDLLRRMLTDATLAAEAREAKIDQEPENARKIASEVARLHAQLRVLKVEAEAGAAFDAKRSTYESRVRELYTVDRKKYATPEQFFASHILFDIKRRSSDEALKLAREARAKVIAGADFNMLARDISEDGSAKRNFGKLDWFTAAEMDPAFAAGVAALKNVGDVSEPVLSSFGWHVIKLEARKPAVQKTFEEARDQIFIELRGKYVDEQREALLARIRNDPATRANREAIDALLVRTDPNSVRRALQQSPFGTSPQGK